MKYLSVEFHRVFFSFKFIIGVIGVVFAQFMSIYKVVGVNTSVYTTYFCSLYFIPYIISFMFCAVTYAQSFCEDIEHCYIQQIILRKNLKVYTALRIATIFISVIITMIIGTLIFVTVVHLSVPWLSQNESYEQDILARFFFGTKHYIIYFVVHSFYRGILAAILSLLAAYTSLFWQNRLLVLSMPFMTYCFLVYYSRKLFENIPQMNISLMFNPSYDVWRKDIISIIWPIVVGITLTFIIGIVTYLKLRRMYNE